HLRAPRRPLRHPVREAHRCGAPGGGPDRLVPGRLVLGHLAPWRRLARGDADGDLAQLPARQQGGPGRAAARARHPRRRHAQDHAQPPAGPLLRGGMHGAAGAAARAAAGAAVRRSAGAPRQEGFLMRLRRDEAFLLVVDVQEKLAPHVHGHEQVVSRSAALIRAASLLGLPVVVSEHCPDRIGPTVPALSALAPPALAKTHFACPEDRKSTRLNSSHVKISYAVFCLQKKTYDKTGTFKK